MDAILLLVSEFSEELIWAQVCLISFWSALYLYQYVVKRREQVTPEFVPASVVKDYLNRVRDGEQTIRFQLFGEAPQAGGSPIVMSAGNDSALLREIEALRNRVGESEKGIVERDKIIADLRSRPSGANNSDLDSAKAAWLQEKAELEKKLAAALAAGGAAGAVPDDVKQQLEDMKARLQEYEVIEDDLANLKKYQLENKQLIEQMLAAGLNPNATVSKVSGTAAMVAPAVTAATAASAASAAPAAAPESAPAAAATMAAANQAAEATPAPAPAASASPGEAPALAAVPAQGASAGGSAPEKKEEDLLSEFEKMLAS